MKTLCAFQFYQLFVLYVILSGLDGGLVGNLLQRTWPVNTVEKIIAVAEERRWPPDRGSQGCRERQEVGQIQTVISKMYCFCSAQSFPSQARTPSRLKTSA